MKDHVVHEWRWHSQYGEDGIDCRLCAEDDSIDNQAAWMEDGEVIRRLNATERLSAEDALMAARAGKDNGLTEREVGRLRAYAAVLEGEDG